MIFPPFLAKVDQLREETGDAIRCNLEWSEHATSRRFFEVLTSPVLVVITFAAECREKHAIETQIKGIKWKGCYHSDNLRCHSDFLFCLWSSCHVVFLWQLWKIVFFYSSYGRWHWSLGWWLWRQPAACWSSLASARRPQLPSVDPQLHRICFAFPLCICRRPWRRPNLLAGRSSPTWILPILLLSAPASYYVVAHWTVLCPIRCWLS